MKLLPLLSIASRTLYKQTGCFFGNPETYGNIPRRKAFGAGSYFKDDEKSLAHAKLDLVEQCV